MEQNGRRIRLHFLPPYCPDHKRIERKWRDLHADVTRNHRHKNIETLMVAVDDWIEKQNQEAEAHPRKRAA